MYRKLAPALAALVALSGAPTAAQGPTTPSPDAAILSTGQTQGFRGNASNPADGNRDDGDLIRGRLHALPPAPVITPTTQAENIVADADTGFMWIRRIALLDAPDNQGPRGNVVLARPTTWQAAIEAAEALEYAGYDDWFLPNVNELSTLVDFGRADPALDQAAFPGPWPDGQSPYFWTSTTNPREETEGFYVNFLDGHAYPWHKAISFSARPVRRFDAPATTAVFRTGQTIGYGGDSGGRRAGNGDDGHRVNGLEQSYSYSGGLEIATELENTAVDEHTGAEWLRDLRLVDGSGGLGGNVALNTPLDWQASVDACNALEYAGHDDWRLPNIRELWTIVQPGRPDGPFDPAAFPNAGTGAGVWWSSTTAVFDRPDVLGRESAWYVDDLPGPHRHTVAPEFRPPKARPGWARCVRDEEPVAHPDEYRSEIRASADVDLLMVPSESPGVEVVGKYLLAASDDELAFRSAFQDTHLYRLHIDFLRGAFPNLFPGLDEPSYLALVAFRSQRRFFAGDLRVFTGASGNRVYGFDIVTAGSEPGELLSEQETAAVFDRLSGVFRRRPLAYSPTTPEAIAEAGRWHGAQFPIAYPGAAPASGYAAYTQGLAYGTVRLTDPRALAELDAVGGLSRQDILVVDGVPADLSSVVAAVITSAPQVDLSHLAVRLSRRGTPNLYAAGAVQDLADLEGRLVRLTASSTGYDVVADVPLEEAEAWWRTLRPPPVTIVPPDGQSGAIADLDNIGSLVPPADLARYGGKTANLARLYRTLPLRHQVAGLGIPFHHYLQFMATNTIVDRRSGAPITRTMADYLALLHADEHFRTDPVHRAALLTGLRSVMEREGRVEAALVTSIAAQLDATFGPRTMVRFRSSSNAEDGAAFNGAGLYESTSVCAADSFDADRAGPSLCDPHQPDERTIERGLARVWSSLWSIKAWEERDWYGIDPADVAMAVLVTPAFLDERANGVAFTGDPANPAAPGYLVNAQLGDVSVVRPPPGVLAERALLIIEDDRVSNVRRLQSSSLVPQGNHVMSDSELENLAA